MVTPPGPAQPRCCRLGAARSGPRSRSPRSTSRSSTIAGPVESLAGDKRVAVVDRGRLEVPELGKVDGPRAFADLGSLDATRPCSAARDRQVDADADPHIDDLDLRRRRRAPEGVKVAPLERLPQSGLRGGGVGAGGERHDQLGGLADIADIGEPEDRRRTSNSGRSPPARPWRPSRGAEMSPRDRPNRSRRGLARDRRHPVGPRRRQSTAQAPRRRRRHRARSVE